MKLKALVLFTNTGSGHVTAAEALYEELIDSNITVKKIDTLKIRRVSTAKNISKLYSDFVIKRPDLFGKIYKMGKYVSNCHMKSPVYGFNIIKSNNLYKIIEEVQPDFIICTHIFSAEAITHIKRKYNIKAITASVVTDYTCAPFWEETELDYIFIPHKDLIDEFASKGIEKGRIIPMGIPIRKNFKTEVSIDAAKKALNYDTRKKHIMIMGGSMGAGDIYNLSNAFIDSFRNEEITIICGTNLNLYNSLINLNLHSNIRVLGFINNISQIMDSADVIISKAGGLTSTEAMVKNIPLILINPIPGVETSNCKFFSEHEMSLNAQNIEESIKMCQDILHDSYSKTKIIKGQKNNINKDSTKDIINFIINKVKERNTCQ